MLVDLFLFQSYQAARGRPSRNRPSRAINQREVALLVRMAGLAAGRREVVQDHIAALSFTLVFVALPARHLDMRPLERKRCAGLMVES